MLFEDNALYLIFKILTIMLGPLAMTMSLLRPRYGAGKTLLTLAVYLVLGLALNLFLSRFLEYQTYALTSLLFAFSKFFVLYYLSEEPPARIVFIGASATLVSAYMIGYVTLLNKLINGNEYSDIALRLGVYAGIVLMELLLLRRPFLRVADTVTANWGILSLIPCTLSIFAVFLAQYPRNYTQNPGGMVLVSGTAIVSVILYFAIFQYLWMQYNYQMSEKNREILNLQIQNIRKAAADTRRKAEAARCAGADAHLLLHEIAALTRNEKWDEIHALLNQASVPKKECFSINYCSDPILNATLNTYLGRAKNSGILLDTRLSFPRALSADSAEFSICLANALENAIIACEKLPKNERRMIVRCTSCPKLMFNVENTYRGKIEFSRDGLPLSPAAGHGIGTRSILAFCQKHDALYSFKARDGWFQVTVVL